MLPTFVIGLREGLEAALIVGIIAAFLRKQGRRDLLRWVMFGVAIAVVLCLGIGIALDAYSQNLPQRKQEGLETVIGILAVGMVTYMVVWMRRNSRNLKGQLEGLAADAMSGVSGAGRAMILMAFLAVIREGLETVVFLLAAFNEASNPNQAGFGVVLGILVAIALGYAIYRGGVRLNLSKFFRATGLVLVVVAAGIVVNALHTAHEAGWLDAGQGSTVDLSWLVEPGTVQASLLTGMLGLQTHPVVAEVVGWLLYLIPVGIYVAWPPSRPAPTRLAVRGGLAMGALAAVAALILAVVAPGRPNARPTTTGGGISAQVVSRAGDVAVVRTEEQRVVAGTTGEPANLRLRSAGVGRHDGVAAEEFTLTRRSTDTGSQPARLPIDRVTELNGGRLPIGVRPDVSGSVATSYRGLTMLAVWLDIRTERVLDLRWSESIAAFAHTATDEERLTDPIATGTLRLPARERTASIGAASADHATLDRRALLLGFAGWSGVVSGLALLVAAGFALLARRTRSAGARVVVDPATVLVRS